MTEFKFHEENTKASPHSKNDCFKNKRIKLILN